MYIILKNQFSKYGTEQYVLVQVYALSVFIRVDEGYHWRGIERVVVAKAAVDQYRTQRH